MILQSHHLYTATADHHRCSIFAGICSKGYTLIEILVVLVIIGITAGVAMLTIQHNQSKQLESFAKELTQLVTLAEERAILQPTVLGVHFSKQAFQFATFQPTYGLAKMTEQSALWKPLNDKLLGKHMIPQDIQIKLEVNHAKIDDLKNNPQIVISANGDMTPFTIFIGKKGGKPRYAIKGSANGNVVNQTLIS